MSKFALTILLSCLIRVAVWGFAPQDTLVLHTELSLVRLSESIYLHVSMLEIGTGEKFPCNGLVYVQGSEAFLFDTPHNDTLTKVLADYLRDSLHLTIKGIVVNHFHVDCLGGLGYLHSLGIPSYAHRLTCQLAQRDSAVCPTHAFDNELTLTLGNSRIICRYFGKAHTHDNIVAWLPNEKALFGGCMVKGMGWGKGNLADADTHAWPKTIKKIKREYGTALLVVPGHGAPGGVELLDYTRKVFR